MPLPILDFIKLAAKGLTERKSRTLLTIVGISIGPLALVSITGVVKGYSNYIISQIQGIGQNLIAVFPSSQYQLTQQDLEFMKTLPGVERAVPFYFTQGIVRRGGKIVNVQVFALPVDAFFQAIRSVHILKGTIPPPTEVMHAVIGYLIAYDNNGNEYYDLGDVITVTLREVEHGGRIRIKRINIVVDGITAEFGGAISLVNPDKVILLPLNAGPRLLGMNKWSGILIIAEDPSYVANITRTLREVYGSQVDVVSLLAIANIAASITNAMNFVTFATGLAAFAVAVTGVAATMITTVMERTREIGVLKAIGFTNAHVMILIILESLLMSLIGAVIGVCLGVVGAYIIAEKGLTIHGVTVSFTLKAKPDITPKLVGEVIGLTLAVGVCGGLLPAYRAAKIPPAVALRYE